jgi:hypothetical protein
MLMYTAPDIDAAGETCSAAAVRHVVLPLIQPEAATIPLAATPTAALPTM